MSFATSASCAAQFDRRDSFRRETQLGAHPLQQREIAGAGAAEAEIRADPDFARLQPRDQQALHELFRRQAGERRVEAQQADAIDAQRRESAQLHPRQLQPRRRRTAGEEFARQGFETQRDRRHAEVAGARHRAAHQRAMTDVQAIEGADADHAAVRAQRPAVEVAEQFSHSGPGCPAMTPGQAKVQ